MFTAPMRGEQTIHITEDTETNFDISPWVHGGQALLTIVVDSGVTVNSTEVSIRYGGNNWRVGAIYCAPRYDDDEGKYVECIDPEKSRVTIRNYGSILGCNGYGGDGADEGSSGQDGGDGCHAVSLNCPIVVYTESGRIESGGGGGGGGGYTYISAGNTQGGSGGGGYPGGDAGTGTSSGEQGEDAQYGPAEGGTTNKNGGDCQGAGEDGTAGQDGTSTGGSRGEAGIGVNSNGNTVTIKSGASNILGGTA